MTRKARSFEMTLANTKTCKPLQTVIALWVPEAIPTYSKRMQSDV